MEQTPRIDCRSSLPMCTDSTSNILTYRRVWGTALEMRGRGPPLLEEANPRAALGRMHRHVHYHRECENGEEHMHTFNNSRFFPQYSTKFSMFSVASFRPLRSHFFSLISSSVMRASFSSAVVQGRADEMHAAERGGYGMEGIRDDGTGSGWEPSRSVRAVLQVKVEATTWMMHRRASGVEPHWNGTDRGP